HEGRSWQRNIFDSFLRVQLVSWSPAVSGSGKKEWPATLGQSPVRDTEPAKSLDDGSRFMACEQIIGQARHKFSLGRRSETIVCAYGDRSCGQIARIGCF